MRSIELRLTEEEVVDLVAALEVISEAMETVDGERAVLLKSVAEKGSIALERSNAIPTGEASPLLYLVPKERNNPLSPSDAGT